MYVNERFNLHESFQEAIREMKPKFGYNGFGETIFYSRYSRLKENGDNESWSDCVIRVINGIMSIRKDWYKKNHIQWVESAWQQFAFNMALSMFEMKWLPPGRGLWAMGTDLIYERGAMPLTNCAFTTIGESWVHDLCWLMDSLMNGVGVGFEPVRTNNLKLIQPMSSTPFTIPDTREGWVDSVRVLLNSFIYGDRFPIFNYSLVRPEGTPIKSFGGTASGPAPLKELHEKITELSSSFVQGGYDEVMYKTDLANLIGCCVVTGNVRRSAEIAIAPINDPIFIDLKNYFKYPQRASHGWMSNNSVKLESPEDFEHMDDLAHRIIDNGEPGFLNMVNFKRARLGHNDTHRVDAAIGINPCGEIPLENKEICILAETLPTRCLDIADWLDACHYATFYASTVTLLPTHQPETNAVVMRNRRIGVGLIDFTGWKHEIGLCKVTAALRKGYGHIRAINKELAEEAGIPESLRVTTVKPGGTIPKLAGRTSGAGHPTFHYTLRRFIVQANTPMERFLIENGVPCEPCHYSKQSTVFEFPIIQGPAVPAEQVSVWEQAMNLILLQREWSDNAVSVTLYFKPKWILEEDIISKEDWGSRVRCGSENIVIELWPSEGGEAKSHSYEVDGNKRVRFWRYNPYHEEDQLEAVLSAIAPHIKSVSLLPHSAKGVYTQMPEEGITKEEYLERVNAINIINWSKYRGNGDVTMADKYCEGDQCQV